MQLRTLYGQHYTNEGISAALVAQLDIPPPRHIVDLGVGQGSLLAAASQRWKNATLTGVDLDPKNVSLARARLGGENIHEGDGLLPDLLSRLGFLPGSIDLALCNPPFIRSQVVPDDLQVVLGFPYPGQLQGNETELAFLARSLQHLRSGGILGIILPDCYIASQRYRPVREALLRTHAVEAVVQLPRHTFSSADVSTHFVTIRKDGPPGSLRLFQLDSHGVMFQGPVISLEEAIVRFDYEYHLGKRETGPTLAELGIDVRRGSYSMAEAKSKGITVFHTTDFKRHPNGTVHWHENEPHRGLQAAPGDILIPRVGSRCLHHCALVVTGTPLLSDCVYRLRSPSEQTQVLWQFLKSSRGTSTRLHNAYGSCAKVLSKLNLLNIRIPQP